MLDEWASSSLPQAPGFDLQDHVPDRRIFSLEVLEENAARGHGLITSVAAGNNVLVAGTNRGWIIRHDFTGGDNSELDLSTSRDQQVHKVFLDPSGRHCLVTLRSSSSNSFATFYVHAKGRKARPVSGLKDLIVNSVAWNKSQLSEASTGEVMIAAASGEIYKLVIEDKKERCSRLFRLTELVEPFTSLQVESISSNNTTRYYILAVTPTKLYIFVGSGTLETVFDSYAGKVVKFTELPGEFQRSEIHFYGRKYAEAFAWLAGPGIFHGQLHVSTQQSDDTILENKSLLEYSKINEDGSSTQPEALSMTEYHFLLLYGGRLKAVNRVSQKLVEEEPFSLHFDMESPNMLGLCTDYAAGAYYAYNNASIFEITVRDEDRDMWKVYLSLKEYPSALQYCRSTNQKDQVYQAQAEAAFDAGKYMMAASFYAKIEASISFEAITLKFWEINNLDGLRSYLLRKLDGFGRNDRSQITMLATWLTELYLNKMNEILQHGEKEEENEGHGALQREFRAFLSDLKDMLDTSTTLKLLESYARNEDYVFFAALKGQHETVIAHHIQQKNAKKAISVLRREDVPPELHYKFAPALIMLDANEVVEFWMSRNNLDPQNLIPALMRYSTSPRSPEEPHQAIKYLEFCIQRLKNEDPTVHNFLVLLLAKQGDDRALLRFLQIRHGRDQPGKPDVFYDPSYALRVCLEEKRKEACVFLYSMMKIHEEAVSLALQVDVDLAKTMADKVEDDEELRKKLWLLIVKDMIKEEKGIKRENIKKVVALVNETEGLLKIEDILPFFPEFTYINEFQEAIYSSLQEYNNKIEDLKEEMNEDTLAAERLRREIMSLSEYSSTIDPDEECGMCNRKVLEPVHGPASSFYVFRCDHSFHTECLVSHTLRSGNKSERDRIMELKKKLSILSVERPLSGRNRQLSEDELVESPLDQVAAQLAECVANECPYCGERACLDFMKPFISADEGDVAAAWDKHW